MAKELHGLGLTDTIVGTSTTGPIKLTQRGQQVGDIKRDNQKTYKLVGYFPDADDDLVVGDFCVYQDASSTLVTTDVSDIAAAEVAAGVALVAIDHGAVATAGTDIVYMWIQVTGLATLSTDIGGTTPVDGSPLTAFGAADKGLTLAKEADSAAIYVDVCAVTIDDSENIVLLKCAY